MARDDRSRRDRSRFPPDAGDERVDDIFAPDDEGFADELSGPTPKADTGKGSGRRAPSRGRIDWEEIDDGARRAGGDDGPGDRDEATKDEPIVAARSRRSATPRSRATLLELATPVIGYCAMLPRAPGDSQPAYESFRREVIDGLRRLEAEAGTNGIEVDDAREACYALSLLLDEQIAESQWSERMRWMGEPLTLMMHQDPEAGVNFFRRLEALQDRQAQVKEVFLICLALGYRGKYVGMDPAQAAAELGAIRQTLLRQIHPVAIDQIRRLFPEAYREASPLADHVPPPPRWWLWASVGAVAVALLIYLGLFFGAGAVGEEAARTLAPVAADIEGSGGTR